MRLARLAPLQYEKERAPAAARHQVRVAFLDAAVKTARSEAEAAAAEQDDEMPYPEPISELAPVLDAALTEMRRYVAGTEPELAAAVLWSLHAHLVHHDKVWLPVSPKLAIQAPDRNCGKSTLLEVVGALTPRPETGSSVTASVVFRLIEARKPTLLIDEADRVLRSSNDELIAVLNSSHRRVWRLCLEDRRDWRRARALQVQHVGSLRICRYWHIAAHPTRSEHRHPTVSGKTRRGASAPAEWKFPNPTNLEAQIRPVGGRSCEVA